MIYWLATMASFLLAPVLYRFIHKLRHGYVVVETLLFFAIAGLVIIHILPESIALAGYAAVATFLASWLLPTFGERFLHKHAHSVHMIPLIVSVVGMVTHGLIDGVSLAYAGDYAGEITDKAGLHYHPLPLAVVVHSFPASLFVWWVLRPNHGLRTAVTVVSLMAAATTVGFFSGHRLLQLCTGQRPWDYLNQSLQDPLCI